MKAVILAEGLLFFSSLLLYFEALCAAYNRRRITEQWLIEILVEILAEILAKSKI